MGFLGSLTLNNLDDLFLAQLEDVYDAENRITEALPKMSKAATSPQLKSAFDAHLIETQGHVRRLQQVFSELGVEPTRETCPAMKGLIKEGSEMIDAEGDPSVKDAALIAAAQRVEHYEMAAYGTLRTLAEHLGHTQAVALFQQTLNEEKNADEKLTGVAMNVTARAPVGAI